MTENNDELETVEVPKKAFIHFAHELVMEDSDHEIITPPGVDTHQFYENLNWRDAESVEIVDDDTVVIRGETIVRKVVDRIPAGPIRNGRPVNPPEVRTKEIPMLYEIKFTMDGLGILSLHAEQA